ncbi:MAG: FtsX-like permease family protein [Pseudomonadota bacterium]
MIAFAWKIALRELRGGLAGFRVFLACLILGVGGIAAVGSVTSAISEGMAAEGQTILGGDVELRFAYRPANEDELAWMNAQGDVSRIVSMRSMLSKGEERALAEVKGVDDAYPLYGEVAMSGGASLNDALAPVNDVPGLLVEPVLAARLGLEPGHEVRLGAGTFIYRGTIEAEPDRASAGFAMGPRVMTTVEGLDRAGMLTTGVIYRTGYRIRVPEGTDVAAMKTAFDAAFPEAGARWRDRANAAPGIARFVQRFGAFLILVGIAALAVGGVGIASAVQGYLTRKLPAIAALRTLGATGATVFLAYAMQIALIAGLGIIAGVALGAGLVALFGPLLSASLPVPADFTIHAEPLIKAAVFGAAAAALFTAWPLSWLRRVRPAELLRRETTGQVRWPGWPTVAVLVALAALFAVLVIFWSPAPWLVAICLGGIIGAVVVLRCLGWVTAWAVRRASTSGVAARLPTLRMALSAVGASGAGTPSTVVALGLGLGVLTAIGQIDANMQRMLNDQLPEGSPAFFFVDIQNEQLDPFRDKIASIDGTGDLGSAPMLRGILTHLDGVPAKEAEIDPAAAWVLRGDRGVSYATAPPAGSVLTEGTWWEAGYDGPPLVSFAEEEGRELGLAVGETITINILGRPITAEVANFRSVEWRSMGINFIMILSPNALAGAPHTHIATLHADEAAEGEILRTIGREMPNVTPVRVRDQITRVSDGLGKLGAATRWGALAVLLTGLAVLIGTAAAGEDRRRAEAAILKVLGASRGQILVNFALRSALSGLIAGLIALLWGGLAAWAVMTFVFDTTFTLEPLSAIAIVLGGTAATLIIGLFFARGPLGIHPAKVLRMAAG